jgi:biopolymer transport protein ExbD
MRYASRQGLPAAKLEMTPMIDMTFQLIAFFMVVVNFSADDQNERIRLPLSELAKPPEEAQMETRITLQVASTDEDGDPLPTSRVILGTNEMEIWNLGDALLVEKQVLEARAEDEEEKAKIMREATIVIRADRAARTGEVQEVIKICQQYGFENFRLRAQQQESA